MWRRDPEMQETAILFGAAATALLDGTATEGGAANGLLARLGYLDGAAELAVHRAALLRAAAGFQRIFTIPATDAPGLVALGAEVVHGVVDQPPASVSGAGLTFGRAFEACVGEGIEHLSQHAHVTDPIIRLDEAAALAGADARIRILWEQLRPYRRDSAGATMAWAQAAALADGTPVLLPVDLCFRRPAAEREIDPPWPLGPGCGAGSDLLAATLHGLFELIERDAVAAWWRGDRRGRAVAPGLGAERLVALRQGASPRATWLLDISGQLRVPVVVAASCDPSGRGLCCGFAARATMAGAADAAVTEMAQMELGYRLAAQKRVVRGDDALNLGDRRHIARFTSVVVTDTLALHPLAPPLPPPDLPTDAPLALLAVLRDALVAAGVAAYALDLTRAEYGVPVVRVVCPGLDPGPVGPRLRPGAADTVAALPL